MDYRGRFEGPPADDTDPPTLEGLLWRGRRLQSALRTRDLTFDGDRALIERFLELFPNDAGGPAPRTQLGRPA